MGARAARDIRVGCGLRLRGPSIPRATADVSTDYARVVDPSPTTGRGIAVFKALAHYPRGP